jgi:hypothetical protein
MLLIVNTKRRNMSNRLPIGTKIKFISKYGDCYGKVGTIVRIVSGYPVVYLPESTWFSCFSTKTCPATVQCEWDDIKPINTNKQMLFDFME